MPANIIFYTTCMGPNIRAMQRVLALPYCNQMHRIGKNGELRMCPPERVTHTQRIRVSHVFSKGENQIPPDENHQ